MTADALGLVAVLAPVVKLVPLVVLSNGSGLESLQGLGSSQDNCEHHSLRAVTGLSAEEPQRRGCVGDLERPLRKIVLAVTDMKPESILRAGVSVWVRGSAKVDWVTV